MHRDLWQITPEHGPAAVGALVAAVLTERGLPQLDALSAPEQLHAYLAGLEGRRAEIGAGPSVEYALLSALLGETATASHLLAAVWRRWPDLRPQVKRAAQRLGLPLAISNMPPDAQ